MILYLWEEVEQFVYEWIQQISENEFREVCHDGFSISWSNSDDKKKKKIPRAPKTELMLREKQVWAVAQAEHKAWESWRKTDCGLVCW